MIFEIKNRWTGKAQVAAEIECRENEFSSVKLGLAVRWAVKVRAHLVGAHLVGAHLVGAHLAGAHLVGAHLARANLAGAHLAGADLAGADLAGANLAGAFLVGANLVGADLAGAHLARADLAGANLAGANLAGAELVGANLAGAFLVGANLAGANWFDGVPLTRPPLQFSGLPYSVTILDDHAQIGCHLLRLWEWEALTEEQVRLLDVDGAVEFWRTWREPLLAMARADGRSFELASTEDF